MAKRKKRPENADFAIDSDSGKSNRGRRGVAPSEVFGRAENYRRLFWTYRLNKTKKEYVPHKRPSWAIALVQAKTDDEISQALKTAPDHIRAQFEPIIPLIVGILGDRSYPKRLEPRIDFLVDSVAARGDVVPRRSRDICDEERAKNRNKSPHHIMRKEFYIECSCGYQGPAKNDACPECGAEISYLADILSGPSLPQ
jgi:hypothetical protein